MTTRSMQLSLATVAGFALMGLPAQGGLIAHYTFDTATGGGTATADEVGTAFATLGAETTIATTGAKVGAGALDLTDNGSVTGAVTSNTFSWANDARTIAYWWKSDSPNDNSLRGAYLSMGDTSADGTRFEVRESTIGGAATIRVEVTGAGESTTPAIDDGQWHFIVITVPNAATFGDVSWFVDGSTTDLNGSTDTQDIQTATSAIVFGDSSVNANDRTPNGFIDDFQLYNEVLSTEQIAFLYNNPGSVIPEPGSLALLAMGGLCVMRRRRN